MNMRYCGYENTYHDLMDCLSDASDHVYKEARYPVSKREIGYFKSMVEEFYIFLDEMGLIKRNGEFNVKEMSKVCEALENCADDE